MELLGKVTRVAMLLQLELVAAREVAVVPAVRVEPEHIHKAEQLAMAY